jgi:hypothetical protein
MAAPTGASDFAAQRYHTGDWLQNTRKVNQLYIHSLGAQSK